MPSRISSKKGATPERPQNQSVRATLRLLLLYRGELSPEELLAEAGEAGALDFATVGYGVATRHLYNGREAEAVALFERIVAAGEWPAFGNLAAEAELARRGGAGGARE